MSPVILMDDACSVRCGGSKHMGKVSGLAVAVAVAAAAAAVVAGAAAAATRRSSLTDWLASLAIENSDRVSRGERGGKGVALLSHSI